MMQYVWLAFVILFVVAECMTVGLVSIWFAGGSLIAMLVFLIVSAGLLMATRPFAKKYINNKKEKTNYKSVIGEVAKVIETIDNYNQTGAAFADGKEWTARSNDDAVVIKKDTLVKVTAVEGVKLIVEPYER